MDTTVFSGPVASGTIKPKIFLPPVMADTWSVHDLEPVLLHELAHIKRHDSVVNTVQMIVQIIYFFNPLVWFANYKINSIREEACDDMAVGFLDGEKSRYSASILNVVEILQDKRSYGLAGFGFAEVKTSLGKRIKRIMNEKYKINQRLTLTSVAALVLIGLAGIAVASGQKYESLEDIIKVAEKGDNMIQSCRGTTIFIPFQDSTEFQQMYDSEIKSLGEKVGTNMGFTIKSETLFTYKNPKFILKSTHYTKEFPGNKDQIKNETYIYDGKDTYYQDIGSEYFVKNSEYDNRPLTGLTYLWNYYIYSTPVSVFLKGSIYYGPSENGRSEKNILLKNFRQLNDEKIRDISCKVFNAELFDNKYNHKITVWLATDMMYRPVKIQDIMSGKDSDNNDFESCDTNNITLKKIQGICFPESIERESLHKDLKTNEWKNPSKSKILLRNFEFNIDIPDSVFAVPEN